MYILNLLFKTPMHLIMLNASKQTGFNAWLAFFYKDHKWLYGLLGLLLIGFVSLTLSFLTDWIMAKLGYKSEMMEHVE